MKLSLSATKNSFASLYFPKVLFFSTLIPISFNLVYKISCHILPFSSLSNININLLLNLSSFNLLTNKLTSLTLPSAIAFLPASIIDKASISPSTI